MSKTRLLFGYFFKSFAYHRIHRKDLPTMWSKLKGLRLDAAAADSWLSNYQLAELYDGYK